jgi:cytochrome c oxidase subunit 3
VAELTAAQKKKVQKPLLWIGLASIVMTFAGLTSGYVVSRSALLADNNWLQFSLPNQFTYATVAIVVSSLLMILAVNRVKHNQLKLATALLGFTLMLGLVFIVLQILGWQDLLDRGLFFTGPNSNTAISWVYVITALHWMHVISGILVLLYTWVKASKHLYTPKNYQGLVVSSIYWHFLDGLWLYLFLFLSFIR